MRIPLKDFGKYGVVNDTLNASLPVGTWTDARNVRFTGQQIEKLLEPLLTSLFEVEVEEGEGDEGGGDTLATKPVWMQGWRDGLASNVVVATQTRLYYYSKAFKSDPGVWIDVSRPGGYSDSGLWDSFSWGNTVIFNNMFDPPQIFNPTTLSFSDLPGWGKISSASDISDGAAPSLNTNSSCRILKPYKNFLVACGISENGEYQPNTVWWSDSTNLASYISADGGGPPNWDYESPATLSGRSEVGIGDGAITCAAVLNENLIVYTESSATAMQLVGGADIMSFRRLFQKGAAARHCAVEVNNRHFVLGRDQIYVHDGSTVQLIAKDRIEEEFFERVGKGGRFGGEVVDWESVQVIKNPDRKEVIVNYTRVDDSPCENCVSGNFPNASCRSWLNPYVRGIDSEILYEASGEAPQEVGGPLGSFAAYDGKIMAVIGGKNTITSYDYGRTWVDYNPPLPYSQSQVSKFAYNPSLDTWYVSQEYAAQETSGIWYSDDRGASWDLMSNFAFWEEATACLEVDPITNYVWSSQAETHFCWISPKYTGGLTGGSNFWTNEQSLEGSCDMLGLAAGYLLVSKWTGEVQCLDIIPTAGPESAFSSETPVRYQVERTLSQQSGSAAFHAPWSKAYKNNEILAILNEGGEKYSNQGTLDKNAARSVAEYAVLDPLEMVENGPSFVIPRKQIYWEEPISHCRLQAGPHYCIAVARPYSAHRLLDPRLLVKWCVDPKEANWSCTIDVTLGYVMWPSSDNNFNQNELFHIDFLKENQWIVGYRKLDGQMVLDSFDLFVTPEEED